MKMLPSVALLVGAMMMTAGFVGCINQLPRDTNRLNAYQAYRNGDFDNARERFMRVLDADPTDWRSHYYYGLIALNHDENPATARRHLAISYEIYEGRATRRLNYEVGDPQTGVPHPKRHEILDALAEAVYQQGHEQTLHAFLREAIENHGTVADHLRMARYMQRIGDPDSARSAFRSATRLDSGRSAEPYLRLAEFYESIGDRSRALVELRKAYAIEPENREANRRLREHGVTPGPTIALPYDYDGQGEES